jgi:hypothetical protein
MTKIGTTERHGKSAYLPHCGSNGGRGTARRPRRKPGEERVVEGASLRRRLWSAVQSAELGVCPLHHALCGARSAARRFAGEVGALSVFSVANLAALA